MKGRSRWGALSLLSIVMMLTIAAVGGAITFVQADGAAVPKGLALEGLVTHGAIIVNDDGELASLISAEGWSGSGTVNDPYVIENLDIDAAGAGNAIRVSNTEAYLTVRGCYLHNVTAGITGDFLVGAGLVLNNARNVTVDGNICTDNSIGITLLGSCNNTVSNNACHRNNESGGGWGMLIRDSNDNVVSNNTCSFNLYQGILVGSSSIEIFMDRNVISYNNCSSNGVNGILLEHKCRDTVVMHNYCNGNTENGIKASTFMPDLRILNTTIAANVLSDCNNGIYVSYYCDNSLIANNTCYGTFHGIVVEYSANHVIRDNLCYGIVGYGIYVLRSDYIIVDNNTCTMGGSSGVCIDEVDHIIISNNTCSGYYNGILTAVTTDVVFSNNTVTGGYYGFKLYQTTTIKMFDNNISDNSGDGVYVYSSSGTAVMSRNVLTHNTGYGIYLDYSCSNIQVFANIFLYNHGSTSTFSYSYLQAYAYEVTSWNAATYGNYWSDWTAPDANGDGIVDSSYYINGYFSGRNYDNYPVASLLSMVVTTPSSSTSYTNVGAASVSGTVAGGFGPATVGWYNAATGGSGTCSGTASWTAEVPLAEGMNEITLIATDQAGYTNVSTVVIGYSGGIMVGTNPSGTVYSDQTSNPIVITATDAVPMTSANYTRYLDGTLVESKNVSESFEGLVSVTFGTTMDLLEGTNIIRVTVNDSAGNSVTEVFTIIVDTTPPTVDITQPLDGSYGNVASMVVIWDASDENGLALVEYRFGGSQWMSTTASSFTATGLSDGEYVVEVRVTDPAGNTATDQITYTIDTSAPTVVWDPPSPVYNNTGTVEISFQASDAFMLDSANWTLYSGSNLIERANVSAAVEGSATASYTHDFTLGAGTYHLYLTVNDTHGNSAVYSCTIVVDLTDPSLSISSPTAGSHLASSSVTVSWVASDTEGIDRFETSLDGGDWTTTDASAHTFSGLLDGPHVVAVRVYDLAGNYNETSVSFVVDTVAPVVTISSPAAGSFNTTGTVNISWSSAADDVDHYAMSVDGGAWVTVSGTSLELELADGAHTVSVRAYDEVDNYGEATVSFSVDTEEPTVTIIGPSNSSYNNTGSVTIAWSADDNLGLGASFISLDGSQWTPATSPYTLELSDGIYTVYVKVTDMAGHDAVASVSFTVDTVLPTIAITSPSNGSYSNASVIAVNWTAGDDRGIAHLLVRIDGGAWVKLMTSNVSALFDGLEDGPHTVDVKVIDGAGNMAMASVTVLVDTAAPTATYSPTGSGVAIDSVIVVRFSEAMNQSSVSIVVSGVTGAVTWSGNNATFTPLSLEYNGDYTVTVSGKDLAGNQLTHSWVFSTKEVGSVQGTVVGEDGTPLANVTVTLGTGMTTTTDEEGRFLFVNVTLGTYTISMTKDGRQTTTVNVTVEGAGIEDLGNITMAIVPSTGGTSVGTGDIVLIAGAVAAIAIVGLVGAFFFIRRKS